MRVLITGSRYFTDYGIVSAALRAEWVRGEPMTVIHGCAQGADQLAHQIADENWHLGIHPEPHPAKWRRDGKAAGFIRNQEMISSGADVCLAFFKEGAGNRGTADCAGRAAKAGIPVKEFWQR